MFVERDENGQVKGLYACLQPGYAEEELAEDHAEVVDFKARMDAAIEEAKNRLDPLAELQAKIDALQAALIAKDPTLETAITLQVEEINNV